MQVKKEYPFELFKGGEGKTVADAGQEARARAEGFTEPYKYQDYPKHLYKNGEREVHPVSGDQVKAVERVVKNAEEEKAARKDGFRMIGEPAPEEAKAPAKKAA